MTFPISFMPKLANLIGFDSFSDQDVHYQLEPAELIEQTVLKGQGVLDKNGALCINTGEFTGRSPLDKFIVTDAITRNTVHWNNFNLSIDEKYFFQLKDKMFHYLQNKKEIWVRDCIACADDQYSMNIRVINENPWSNLFCYNMFLRPDSDVLGQFEPEWHIIQAPGFKANPTIDGTRQHNFAIISFKYKTVLIGGTGYTGEMKKGIFTILNFLLPQQKHVLSMHCSANIGKKEDVAIFFGLSGTGKTTLSADPNRRLIGDDEHGWDEKGVFNFEGGCYAKTIDLSEEKEPDIFRAIKTGALVENTVFYEGTNEINFHSKEITENTRVSYPLYYIKNALDVPKAGVPQNIFFLTCDAYGVLPPVSKLTKEQAMYHFISGYTAKIPGTEEGIKEPKSTFSACFGAPFLPLHPGKYAEMLGKKIDETGVNVWLINTGWSGGAFGVGSRIRIAYTRAMITAALNGNLQKETFIEHPIFKLQMPMNCEGVPSEMLNPENTWADKKAYNDTAVKLAGQFVTNFEKYADGLEESIKLAGPAV